MAANEDRFWAKVQPADSDACWLWQASKDRQGYGYFNVDGKTRKSHRVAWELLRGDIPNGLVLDHLCRQPSCVNPFHMEPVTNAVNLRRGNTGQARKAERANATTCYAGHPYNDINTYYNPNGGRRDCRVCANTRRALKKAVAS